MLVVEVLDIVVVVFAVTVLMVMVQAEFLAYDSQERKPRLARSQCGSLFDGLFCEPILGLSGYRLSCSVDLQSEVDLLGLQIAVCQCIRVGFSVACTTCLQSHVVVCRCTSLHLVIVPCMQSSVVLH